MFKRHTPTWVLGCALACACTAYAADPVTDALVAANAPYRVALYKTNSQSQTEAEQALAQAQKAWQALRDRFGDQPPAPYNQDPEFASTLRRVAEVYTTALGQVQAGELSRAHASLEAVRDLTAALRERNQIVVFSDHMNDYHAQMEHLLTDGTALLDTPQGWTELTAQTGVLRYLAARLQSKAGADLKGNPEFVQKLKSVMASVAQLEHAVWARDAEATRNALQQLKKPYSQLFAQFG
ncbi:MAG: hypothetical protein OHK0048_05940 [Rhodoferax sp.]